MRNFLSFLGYFLLCTWLSAVETVWPHQKSDLPPDRKVHWGVLPNGFRYAILPNLEPPERISLRLLVEAGSLQETEAQRGLAHFLEHMAFNGTRRFPKSSMVEYFQRQGMAFGADTNAHTGFTETVYKLELPLRDPALLQESLQLLRDYADGMLLDPDDIEAERGVILAEKRARDSVETRAFEAEFAFLLPNSLLSRRLPIGQEQVIKNAPPAEFLDYYRRWYTADRLVLVAVGAVLPEDLPGLIEEIFGSLPASRPTPEPDIGAIRPRGTDVGLHLDPEASATNVSIQFALPIEATPDTAAQRATRIRLEIALAILNRRLEIRSRETDAPFFRGVAYCNDWFDIVRNGGLELTGRPEHWPSLLAEAESQLRRALLHGFSQSELEEASAKLRNAYRQAVQQAPTRHSDRLADALVAAISQKDVFTHPETDYALVEKTLAEVTPSDVWETFSTHWPSDEALIFIQGNIPPERISEKAVFQEYIASLRRPVAPPAETTIPAFAYTTFGASGKLVARQEFPDIGTTRLDFANGVSVFLKPTTFEANVIHVAARFGRGLLEAPPSQPGLALLAESCFLEGGLLAHRSDDLERIFAGRTLSKSFAVEEDAFLLVGKTNREDFAAQCQLLAAFLTAPGYRTECERPARQRLEKLYEQLDKSIDGVAASMVSSYLGGGDFRFGYPPKSELDRRTLEEVRQWLTSPLQESALSISIVGDFQEEALLPSLAATFGALPPRRSSWDPCADRRLVHPPKAGPASFTAATSIPKALVMVCWPTEDIWDIGRSRRFSVLASVLDDRLRVRIREELGEAYSPYAYHQPSSVYTGYGFLQAVTYSAPEKASQLAELIRTMGAELAQHGLRDEDERIRAQKPTLERIKLQLRNNQYWLNSVLLTAAEFPQRLRWPTSIESDFSLITTAEINSLAARYLGYDRAISILILPHTETPSSP